MRSCLTRLAGTNRCVCVRVCAACVRACVRACVFGWVGGGGLDVRSLPLENALWHGCSRAWQQYSRLNSICGALLPAQADNVFQEAFDTMKEWPLEWRTMPQRVFSSTLAWLRLRRMGGPSGGGVAEKQAPAAGAARSRAGAEEGEDADLSANGGWGRDATRMRQYELNRCDIPRRSADEMTVAQFHR